jgi:hypothetical protein
LFVPVFEDHNEEFDFNSTPAVELCIEEVEDVSAPGSINFTNLFQSESVGTCQPDRQIFL